MDTHASDAHASRELDAFVRAERVRFVFIQSALPMFFSPIAAAVLSVALWHVVRHEVLVAWTAGLAVIAAVRLTLVRSYPKETPSDDKVRRWERLFVGSILVVDLWWGVGALFLLVPDDLAARAIVFLFVMLMASGHASSYAAHPVTVMGGVLSLALPITVSFALHNDTAHRAMAFASLMYLAATSRSIRTLGYFFGRSHRLSQELQRQRDLAEELARTDFLTGLRNRRAFFDLGSARLREDGPVSLVMLDIDHFKGINDRFGHAAGDEAIRALAAILRMLHRNTDVAGRLGGEEFALLLPGTTLAEAKVVAERLREKVGSLDLVVAGGRTRFTASCGVVQRNMGEDLGRLLARADEALYAAKHAGRNRVVAA